MVIVCLGDEVAKVVEPVKKYSADIVIGLHDCFIYKETYDIRSPIVGEAQEKLKQYNPNLFTLYLEHNLHNFTEVANFLESVANFTASKLKCDVFVNISTGPNEFAAAATMISMLHPHVQIFSVGDIDSNMNAENLRTILYRDDKPTGRTVSVTDPFTINTFESKSPEKHLVLGLHVLDECMKKDPYPMAKMVIHELMERNIWLRDEPSPNDGVFYLRDFVDKWVEYGWIEKGPLRNRYTITEKGRMILDIFISEPDFSL